MAINKRLLVKPPSTGITPSEHFGVVLYEGDGSSSHSINGGKFGAGGYFTDSNSSYISRDSGFLPMGNAARTFSFWVMVNSHSTDQYFLSYGDGASGQFFSPRIRPTNQGGYIGFMGYAADLDSNVAMTTGEWMHLCYTYDGTTLKIYKNATEIASGSLSLNTSTARDFTIGARDLDGTRSKHMNGKLDQLRIFTKALSSSQVSTLYAETAATVESLDPLNVDTTDTLQVLGDSSCIATYRFENNEDDLSGNYDGTGESIQYTAGRYGQAARFSSGLDAKMQLSSKILADNDNLTVSFWIKNMSCGDYGTIIGEGVDSQTSGYNVQINPDDNSIDFFRSAGGGSYVFSGNSYNFGISGSDWVHCCFTVSTTQLKYYKNGVNVLTASVSNTSSVTGNYNTSFMWDEKYERYQKGDLDQVRVFHKTLSAAEVTTLYNENPLVASYRFEGNANDDMRTYDGTASNVTYEYGLGFTPDFVWIKSRSFGRNHYWYDTTRGANKQILSNATDAEATISGRLTAFDTGGFTVGSSSEVNNSGETYVAWSLKANGGTTSSNTDGTITSTVQVNTDAGFSIIKYTGTGSAATVGHGLNSTPEMIIVKNLAAGENWAVYHSATGVSNVLFLNEPNAATSVTNKWAGTNSTVFGVNSAGDINQSGVQLIAYAFKSIEGFSKFGSYTGNGSATSPPIIETGFEPAFVMIKNTENGSTSWAIADNKRGFADLYANSSDAEFSSGSLYGAHFLSNGFTLNTSDISRNANNIEYIYMAFAADPDTEQPTVAKSFGIQTWSGDNSTTRTISGYGFQPSLVWVKWRTGNYNHAHILYTNLLNNPSANSGLSSSSNAALNSYKLTQFTDDGFQFASPINAVNENNFTFVGWAWKADDNEPTINTEGSIDSLVSANANAGFSIIKYTGNGVINQSIGHGLSAAPELYITKNLDTGGTGWFTKTTVVDGSLDELALNTTDAASNITNTNLPTSSVIYQYNNTNLGANGQNYIVYAFHSVSGYSKIGSYSGTGTTNSITGLGFQPDWLMIKRATGGSSNGWVICDSVRGVGVNLRADTNGAEADESAYTTSFDSDGFTLAQAGGNTNVSGSTYIYMAFKIN